MGRIDKAVDISQLGQRSLWVIYGKSGSGKTKVLASFPKPLLYLRVGDDGSNTIREEEGIKAISVNDPSELRELLLEARLDNKYKTIAVDTFSLIVNEWIDINIIKKKKRMTQQAWGDLKTDTEEFIKLAHILAEFKIVVLTCHEAGDALEGFEDEITPDIRPSISKGARTYLEGMANYGIHTTLVEKTQENASTSIVYAAHIGANPYYWTKTQKPSSIKLPKLLANPTYTKIMKKLRGE
jgi:hypothetical protein